MQTEWTQSLSGTFQSSSPVCSNQSLFISDDNAQIYSISTADGNLNWTGNVSGKGRNQTASLYSPTCTESGSILPVASNTHRIYTFNIQNGDRNVITDLDDTDTMPIGVTSSTIYAAGLGEITALSLSSGNPTWTTGLDPSVFPSSITLLGDTTIYSLDSANKNLYAHNSETGALSWHTDLPSTPQSASYHDGTITYTDHEGHICFINTEVEEISQKPLKQSNITLGGSPLVSATQQGALIRTTNGSLICFDYDGSHNWTTTLDVSIHGIGTCTFGVYVTSAYTLHALSPDTGDYLWSVQSGKKGTYSPPDSTQERSKGFFTKPVII
jgi:outer membrane protein assembly factor BamB